MLLMPQHFQQQAGRFEALIPHTAAMSGSSHPWGFVVLKTPQVVPGVSLTLIEATAVMPDGSVVEVEGAEPLTLDLAQLDAPDTAAADGAGESRIVFLALPKQTSLAARADGQSRYLAYESTQGELDDPNQEPVILMRLRARLELIAARKPPERFVALPAARLVRNSAGQWDLDGGFEPAFLRVTKQQTLWTRCSDAVEKVRAAANMLRNQPIEMREQTTSDAVLETALVNRRHIEELERKMQAHALSAGVPAARAALDSEACHPFSLYLLLCALAGQVSLISPKPEIPHFPAYHHADPFRSFDPVLRYISEALSTVATKWGDRIVCRPIEDGFEAERSDLIQTALDDEGDPDDMRVIFAVRAGKGATEADVTHWCLQANIGPASTIRELQTFRVAGFKRRRVERVQQLSVPAGMILFAVFPMKSDIRKGEPIQIVNQGPHKPVEMLLYVRRSESHSAAKAAGSV
jgi:type VI secretion system protein ImpJ